MRHRLRLIAITDSLRDGIDGLTQRACAAVEGGVTMIQLRLEGEAPQTLVDVARAFRTALPGTPLIVNARFDIALATGADGVYLGVDDISAAACRRATSASFLIGASVGHESEISRVGGADFVGIGPVFGAGGSTDSGVALGVERFATLAQACGLPAVAIGGVNADNIRVVMDSGAAGVGVISALFGSANPAFAARHLRDSQDAIEM